jgi:hypothetical protein
MAADRSAPLAAAALVGALALTGCSGSGPADPTPAATTSASSPTPSSSPSPAASTESPSPAASTESASASPSGFDRTATPGTSSGPLTGKALPDPEVLGSGWVARVDPGSAEDGYTGNGTPVVARDPQDLAQAILPIGCADASVYDVRLPVPAHALEADYAYSASGAHGVALALDFGDEARAERFVAAYTGALRRCTAGPGGSMVVTVAAAPAGSFASVQKDSAFGTTWRELVTRSGAVVRMVAVEGSTTPARSWARVVAALPAL